MSLPRTVYERRHFENLVMEVLVHYCNLLGCSTSTIQWRDRKKAKAVVNTQATCSVCTVKRYSEIKPH
ncbi:hypothetical protein AMECASPLE_019660 [Ameca splendens]|uniref:Uncharacterized protein n=1 Tax=Ameca splendens TaxID=208324 RepID=A0ABV0ZCT5_9TELE